MGLLGVHTHAPGLGWGEWRPTPGKGTQGGARESGDSGRGVWWEPVTAGEQQGGGQESSRGPYREFGGEEGV